MSSLRPCPACRRHVETHERVCPFCAAALPADFHAQLGPAPRRATSRAALLFLGAITGDGLACAVPPYGVGAVRAPLGAADAGTDAGKPTEEPRPTPGSAEPAKSLTPTPDRVAAVPPYGVAPVRLETPYEVEVTVVDARKRPVAGATVSVGGGVPPAVTNAKGKATLRVPAGPSELRVLSERLEASQAIDAQGNLKVRVVLKKTP